MVFSRTYRWPEHYFFLWSLTNSQKLLTANRFFTAVRNFLQFLNIYFFSLHFDLFSIIAKEVNQIRNNVPCVAARLGFLFFCAFTTSRWNAFQHIFVNEFYGPYFQTILFLVTLFKYRKWFLGSLSLKYFWVESVSIIFIPIVFFHSHRVLGKCLPHLYLNLDSDLYLIYWCKFIINWQI